MATEVSFVTSSFHHMSLKKKLLITSFHQPHAHCQFHSTLKMVTTVFAETLDNFQHPTRLMSKSRRTLNCSCENLSTRTALTDCDLMNDLFHGVTVVCEISVLLKTGRRLYVYVKLASVYLPEPSYLTVKSRDKASVHLRLDL